MSDTTPNLSLPFIMPSQAQKHVTHNEALLDLDALVQMVLSGQSSAPPSMPAEGTCFWVTAGATGAWTGKSGRIAAWQDGAWTFLVPKRGWRAYDLSSGRLKIFDGSDWADIPLPETGSFDTLGVSSIADSTNRLSVSAPATLLNHAGAGHQLKINKSAAGDTASLLFQTAWQGRAEFGLTGSDQFGIKVSADGSTWTTALTIGADGITRTDTRPAVRAARSVVDHAPATGTLSGFNSLPSARGGFSLGTALPSGLGNRLLVPADGVYLVGLNLHVLNSAGHGARLLKNGSTVIASIEGMNAASNPFTQSTLSLAALVAGDWLAIEHQGSATLGFGPGRTEIFAAMI